MAALEHGHAGGVREEVLESSRVTFERLRGGAWIGREPAARHGTSAQTVRLQLDQVYGNTGAAGRLELAALLIGPGELPESG